MEREERERIYDVREVIPTDAPVPLSKTERILSSEVENCLWIKT